MHFHQWEFLYFDSNFTKVCSRKSSWQYNSTGTDMSSCWAGSKPLPELKGHLHQCGKRTGRPRGSRPRVPQWIGLKELCSAAEAERDNLQDCACLYPFILTRGGGNYVNFICSTIFPISEILRIFKTVINYWISSSYLTGVTTAEPSQYGCNPKDFTDTISKSEISRKQTN